MEKYLSVELLRPGVFVCRLDRPWLETPFLLQGFEVRDKQDIEDLKRYCKFVFIDPERGLDPPGSMDVAPEQAMLDAGVRQVASLSIRPVLPYQVEAEEELDAALEAHTTALETAQNILSDARFGRSLDSRAVKAAVAKMVASIMRNPDALLFLNKLKNKDRYTTYHSIGVCILSLVFGRHLNMSEAALGALGLGGLLHDIGKMRIPQEVLNKPDRLTAAEFELMKRHVAEGVEILNASEGIPATAIEVVQNHHERLNGSGYPRGLRATAIGTNGLIAGIVDVYDALTSDRVYGKGITSYEALKHLYSWRGRFFDESLVLRFIQSIGVYPVGSLVELSTGETALVIAVHPDRRLQPRVSVLLDADGQPYKAAVVVDLMTQGGSTMHDRVTIRRMLDPAACGLDPSEYLAHYLAKEGQVDQDVQHMLSRVPQAPPG